MNEDDIVGINSKIGAYPRLPSTKHNKSEPMLMNNAQINQSMKMTQIMLTMMIFKAMKPVRTVRTKATRTKAMTYKVSELHNPEESQEQYWVIKQKRCVQTCSQNIVNSY
jgi:hypothetical protein